MMRLHGHWNHQKPLLGPLEPIPASLSIWSLWKLRISQNPFLTLNGYKIGSLRATKAYDTNSERYWQCLSDVSFDFNPENARKRLQGLWKAKQPNPGYPISNRIYSKNISLNGLKFLPPSDNIRGIPWIVSTHCRTNLKSPANEVQSWKWIFWQYASM